MDEQNKTAGEENKEGVANTQSGDQAQPQEESAAPAGDATAEKTVSGESTEGEEEAK